MLYQTVCYVTVVWQFLYSTSNILNPLKHLSSRYLSKNIPTRRPFQSFTPFWPTIKKNSKIGHLSYVCRMASTFFFGSFEAHRSGNPHSGQHFKFRQQVCVSTCGALHFFRVSGTYQNESYNEQLTSTTNTIYKYTEQLF